MWDPFQHEVLSALGHSPLVLAPPVLADDALLHALLKAAGRDSGAVDLAQLLPALPATATLRGNPRAKRALWPRLRRLRAGSR